MKAFGNLIHGGALGVWALMGLLFTLKVLMAAAFVPGLMTAGSYWLWFAGLAGFTTWAVSQTKSAIGPLLIHAGAFLVLSAIPRVFPLSLLRLGLDLLMGR